MVHYSPIPNLDNCRSASTYTSTCNTLLSQTFLMMIYTIQEEVKMKISIERDLQIYTPSTDFQGTLKSLTIQTNGGGPGIPRSQLV